MQIGTRIALTASALVALAFGTYSWVSLRETAAERTEDVEREARQLASALRATIEHIGFRAFAADREELYEGFVRSSLPWRVDLHERGQSDPADPVTRERMRSLITLDRPLYETVPVDGHRTYVYLEPVREASPVPGEGYRIVGAIQVSRDMTFLDQELEVRKTRALATMALLLGVLALGIYTVTRNGVGRPLHKLLAGIDDVTKGDLSHVLLQEREDEIGALAARFNAMTASLREAKLETLRGMTAKLALEHQLRRTEKLATVGQLAAEIAHEVGTPLNVVTGRAKAMARRAEDPEAVRKNATIIAEQASRITRIIQRLLDFARRGAGVRDLDIQDVDLNDLVSGSLEFLEDQVAKAGVTVHLRLDQRLPDIPGQRDQLQQVMLNLVMNALQAMPQGGSLEVETSQVTRRRPGLEMAPEQLYAVLCLTDTGVGIPESIKERIFEPFATSREGQGGTGLGLAVSLGIVKEHDGWIDFVSPVQEGRGTRFLVYLPLVAESRIGEITGRIVRRPGDGLDGDPDSGSGDAP